ncbi:MAG TPA: cytochrome c oxidase subunit II [Gemmatimonadaceae bacterium]|jgi:cytochrome c oxidase subunit 2|nr:cytochrome c oxidase subunit II [Gemmatimonadaceae bacterium]
MTRTHRPRKLLAAGGLAALILALAACGQDYPNSTFNHHTEYNTLIDALWDKLLFWGTVVFVLVEALLVYVMFKYRRREGGPAPKHVHGNTTLEIMWTVAPALILVFIAVPTVQTIFRTQAKAAPNSLEVEVIGHQWWWEFRYPQYGIVTANELYLPIGHTANFTLRTRDVVHSFWIPQMGGKRDLISYNKPNYVWFTPDSALASSAWNGFCAEYCGASHANMKFRVFTVTPAEFQAWAQHQKTPAAFGAVAGATPHRAPGADTTPPPPPPPQLAAVQPAAGYISFPREKMDVAMVPATPTPEGLTFPDNLVGDAERGRQIYSSQSCIGCHAIAGNPVSFSEIGPNLTHVGSRTTIAAGLFPNDTRHLALWIKNSRAMKPGSIMPTMGKNQYDPITKTRLTIGLDDQQIADVVAYLQALK